jgi:hypothetical protein
MTAALLRRTVDRLQRGEPLRVLIGEKLYDASEIVLLPATDAHLRGIITADLLRQIAELDPDPSHPHTGAPVGAQIERAA